MSILILTNIRFNYIEHNDREDFFFRANWKKSVMIYAKNSVKDILKIPCENNKKLHDLFNNFSRFSIKKKKKTIYELIR